MKYPCKYNLIRFQPYAETDEFANVGITLYSTLTQTLHFKLLLPQQTKRITGFFEQLDKEIFKQAIRTLQQELERVEALIGTAHKPLDLYEYLTKPSDGIIRYGAPRAKLTADPAVAVLELYDYYVNRSFTREPSHEELMQKRLHHLLQQCQLDHVYKERVLGDKVFEVRLPFATEEDKPKILKPIHFTHTHSKKLIEHGLYWLTTMDQLFRKRLAAPEKTLFAYQAPYYDKGLLVDAFEDIKAQIKERGIQLLPIADEPRILEFAK
jgi:hypothetical protein